MRATSGALGVALAVARRPGLWGEALGAALDLAPPGWWRRWPPLPLPDARYWRFRMVTAYGGSGDAVPRPADVVEYLEWRRSRRRPPRALR